MAITRKNCIRILKIVLFIIIVICIYKALSYAFVDDTESMARVTFHDYYEMEGDIDALFIGPSHIQRGLNANILSEELGINCFNLGTTAQRLSGTYYLTKDALANNDLQNIYLEVSLSIISSEDDTYSAYIMSDYMKMSPSKIQYLTSILPDECFTNKWSPLCRTLNINDKLNMEKALQTVEKKRTSELYRSYLAAPEPYEYTGAGSWQDTSGQTWEDLMSVQYGDDGIQDIFVTPERFHPSQMGYLEKIVEDCRKKDVPLTFMIFPFTDLYIASNVEEYTASISYIEQYCAENSIAFVDFNRVSREDLPLTDDCFCDMDHLNAKGVEIFSRFLAEYIRGDADVMWYASAADRIAEKPGIYGVIYQRENDWDSSSLHMTLSPVYTIDETITWHAEILEQDTVLASLGDYTDADTFLIDVPMEYMGKTLRLEATDSGGNALISATIAL